MPTSSDRAKPVRLPSAPLPGMNLVMRLFFRSFIMEPGLLLFAAPALPAADEVLAREFCLASLIGTRFVVAVGVSSNDVVSFEALEWFAAVLLLFTVVIVVGMLFVEWTLNVSLPSL